MTTTRIFISLTFALMISIVGISTATATTDADHFTPCTGLFDNCFVDISHFDDRR